MLTPLQQVKFDALTAHLRRAGHRTVPLREVPDVSLPAGLRRDTQVAVALVICGETIEGVVYADQDGQHLDSAGTPALAELIRAVAVAGLWVPADSRPYALSGHGEKKTL